VFGSLDLRPVGCREWDSGYLHERICLSPAIAAATR
jgi:hypothetical protein